MAIYHFHAKTISRGAGRSAIAAVAYRRACKMKDKSTNESHNYSKKHNVDFSCISIPEDSPEWLSELAIDGGNNKSSEILWNKVEAFEKRKDARFAREVEFALPKELSLSQNIELAKTYIENHITSKGIIADWSLHNNEGNPHVHVMMPTRPANIDGFGLKNREWNSRTMLNDLRKSWADTANKFMQELGIDASIDHRSYAEQGINLIPQVHLSNGVDNMYSRDINSDIIKIYHEINDNNLKIITDNPNELFTKIINQKSAFSYNDIADNLYKYIQKTIPVENVNSDQKIRIEIDPSIFNVANDGIEFLTKSKIAEILERIEYHDSVFTIDRIEKELSQYTTNYKQLARAIVEVKNSRSVISLGIGEDGKERFTTANMFQIERNIQINVNKLLDNQFANIAENDINRVLSLYESSTGKKLTEEQDKAVRHIVGKESISCIVGRAGTGKSFSLAAAKAIWDDKGNQVLGVALSGIAADGLVKDANMNSRTIASFLLSVDNGSVKLDSNTVIVMDEAGMTDSLSMQKILKLAENHGSKIVLVGDPAQLQPVGPGAAFRAILEKTGFAEIQTVYRQKEQWQRDATVDFSKANTGAAIQSYYDNGCVHLLNNSDEAINALVKDWQTKRTETHKDTSKFLVVAHRNADVKTINEKIRDVRVANGEISEGYKVKNVVAGQQREIRISQNDRILFLKNDKNLGVANGRFATITYVNFSESGNVIDFNVKLDGTDKEITINPNTYEEFDYGYAATVHKTQGVTVDHSFVYGGGNLNSSLTYVAMTRHKETTGFYASYDQYKDIDHLKERVSRLDTKDSVLNYLDEIDDYAGRRGIETNQKTLKQALVDSLTNIKNKLIDVFVSKQQHYQNVTTDDLLNNTVESKKEIPAKVVGDYVQTRKEFGMVYAALKPKLQSLGFEKISYEPDDFAIISKIPEYHDLAKLNDKMNQLAYTICSDIESSKVAIQLNKIDIEKLKSQAYKHEVKLRVETYNEAVKNDLPEQRKLAYVISKDMSGHFVALKSNEIDLDVLRNNSNQWLNEQVIANRDAAKFDTFDSAVRGYLELELTRYNLEKNIKDSPSDELKAEHLKVKTEILEYAKKFEKLYKNELASHDGSNKDLTISKLGGTTEMYKRCIEGALSNNDLHAISRQVAYYQITDLIKSRNAYFEANKSMQDAMLKHTDDIKFEVTPPYSEYLKAKLNFDIEAKKTIDDYDQIDRAIGVYNIKPSELNRAAQSINYDKSLQLGVDYLRQDENSKESYELAYELSSDTKHYPTIKKFGIDEKLIYSQVNELLNNYVLNKVGLNELTEQSPAKNYVDIVNINNKSGFYTREEQELQSFLTEYLEARTLEAKLFNEVNHNRQVQFRDNLKAAITKVQELRTHLLSDNKLQSLLSDKYNQGQFDLSKQPMFKGGNNIAYMRAIQGKSTIEDYAALKTQVSKLSNTQSINKSLKR